MKLKSGYITNKCVRTRANIWKIIDKNVLAPNGTRVIFEPFISVDGLKYAKNIQYTGFSIDFVPFTFKKRGAK